ncbi:beta family protein [Proteus terrae]|uniref:beta family protein n=1 Tax=Proteus terrae TaxID=1574161 RepID=UPI00288B791F|nr:protein beta [Proteus terrae]
MFLFHDNFKYLYSPILSLSPSEMDALKQLPSKDKDLILPIIPLKGWSTSKKLENSLKKINNVIDNRKWIASIDQNYLLKNKVFLFTGEYPREVFYQLKDLLNVDNGYENWFNFLRETPNAIPSAILDDKSQLKEQIIRLNSLNRGIAFIFDIKNIDLDNYLEIINTISKLKIEDIFLIYDIGTINNNYSELIKPILDLIQKTKRIIPFSIITISASSFPLNFAGYHRGENPIFERLLFNKIKQKITNYKLIYSDRGSARIENQKGGGGLPPPRIDYALKNDWRFIRYEYENPQEVPQDEKKALYSLCAKEIMQQEYWSKNLHLWGTQQIELTAQGDEFGIKSPQGATAVRINLHLYTQLHYDDELDNLNTDEDWED